jgi:hypothetical protein
MLSGLWAFLKIFATALGMIERKQERDTGAALQRETDFEEEAQDVDLARRAGEARATGDAALDDLDELLRDDPSNRLRKR